MSNERNTLTESSGQDTTLMTVFRPTAEGVIAATDTLTEADIGEQRPGPTQPYRYKKGEIFAPARQ